MRTTLEYHLDATGKFADMLVTWAYIVHEDSNRVRIHRRRTQGMGFTREYTCTCIRLPRDRVGAGV